MISRSLPFLLFKFILCYVFFNQSVSTLTVDPRLRWRSIKTEHFWVHYHQGLEGMAQKTAKLAEVIHAKLALKIKWEPALRTDIVLVDQTDQANGYATPFPYNKVVLFPVRPEMDTALERFDDWLDLLLTHEYTHTLTLDMTYGLAKVLKYIFGRIYFINILQPAWVLEGFAVHQESLSNYGRNNSTYGDMIMRNEVADDSFDSINDVSHFFHREWPINNQYIYGGRFIQYLNKTYGENSFTSVYEKQAKNFWPYQASDNMEAIYGYEKDLNSLWDEWRLQEEKKQREKIEEIKKQPLTNYRLLNTTGFHSGQGRFDPSGKFLYYIQDANDTEMRLFRYEVPNETQSSWFKKKKLISNAISDVNDTNFLSVGEKGKVFISDLEVYHHFSRYYDIFRFDVDNSKLKQLSHGLRAHYVDYSKIQKKIVFVQNEASRCSIFLSEPNLRKIEKLVDASEVQFAFTRFSPDGTKIAFSFKDKSSFSQIAILGLKKEREKISVSQITSGDFNHLQPSWHPGGNRLIFSSDRSKGVYNLFSYNIQSKKISQLTNVVGGFFYPDISPNGKLLAATTYNSTGFNQALLSYPKKSLKTVSANSKKFSLKAFQGNQNSESEQKTKKDDLPSQEYTPFASIAPLFWLPPILLFNTENSVSYGLSIFSSDALELNLYELSGVHSIERQQIVLQASYSYTGFWPHLSISYYTNQITYGDVTHESTSQRITGSVSLPFIYFQTSHQLGLTYNFWEAKLSSGFFKNYPQGGSLWWAVPTLSYEYDTTDNYRKSISPEDGRNIRISASVNHGLHNVRSFSYQTFLLYHEYLPGFFKNNVWRLTFVASGVNSSSRLADFEYQVATGIMYSFPVWQPDSGFYKISPFLIRDIWFDAYFASGSGKSIAYNFIKRFSGENNAVGITLDNLQGTAGLQLNIQSAFLYRFPIKIFAGYYYTFHYRSNAPNHHQGYAGVTTSFFSRISSQNSSSRSSSPLNTHDWANQDIHSFTRPKAINASIAQLPFLINQFHP